VTLKIKSLFILSILALSVTGINGCAGFSKRKADLKMPGKEREAVPERPIFTRLTPAEGSLWTDSGKAQLFVDLRARRVGDTVTVDIVENTTSKMDANTKATRSSSVEAKIEHMLGYMRWLEEKNKRLNKDVDGELANTLFKGNLENKFDGKGSSDRSGQVTASIGAVVVKVLPNGNLVLYGRREMKVNNELQYITVSGIARPEDISTDNRIQSIFLADSRIEYSGKGVIADKQRPGWGARVLDFIWPF